MSVFRLVVTGLWTVSLGFFLVFLEAERVRMQHEIRTWEQVREHAVELRAQAVFNYWVSFQEAVPAGSLLEHLSVRGEEGDPSNTQ